MTVVVHTINSMTKVARFYLRMSDDDRRKLDEASEALSVKPSQLVRMLVAEKHRELFGLAPNKKKKRSR